MNYWKQPTDQAFTNMMNLDPTEEELFFDIVETVRQGYKTAAQPYSLTKDSSILSIPTFEYWVKTLLNEGGYIAELG